MQSGEPKDMAKAIGEIKDTGRVVETSRYTLIISELRALDPWSRQKKFVEQLNQWINSETTLTDGEAQEILGLAQEIYVGARVGFSLMLEGRRDRTIIPQIHHGVILEVRNVELRTGQGLIFLVSEDSKGAQHEIVLQKNQVGIYEHNLNKISKWVSQTLTAIKSELDTTERAIQFIIFYRFLSLHRAEFKKLADLENLLAKTSELANTVLKGRMVYYTPRLPNNRRSDERKKAVITGVELLVDPEFDMQLTIEIEDSSSEKILFGFNQAALFE